MKRLVKIGAACVLTMYIPLACRVVEAIYGMCESSAFNAAAAAAVLDQLIEDLKAEQA